MRELVTGLALALALQLSLGVKQPGNVADSQVALTNYLCNSIGYAVRITEIMKNVCATR